MTVKYYAILTNQGAARLANATMLGSKLNLTRMAVGDANGVLPTPDPAQTKLINQKRIAPLNLLSVDLTIRARLLRSKSSLKAREDSGSVRLVFMMIKVYSLRWQTARNVQTAVAGRQWTHQTIRMILVVTNTEAITLKIDPVCGSGNPQICG
ncbi:phage tail collar protein [Escherichia coli]|nr:phage tail collar protein [Escherichia coli]